MSYVRNRLTRSVPQAPTALLKLETPTNSLHLREPFLLKLFLGGVQPVQKLTAQGPRHEIHHIGKLPDAALGTLQIGQEGRRRVPGHVQALPAHQGVQAEDADD